MKIAERVTHALKVAEKQDAVKAEKTVKCMEFVKRMEKSGVLRADRETTAPMNEGGIKQLKLYALSTIEL